MVVVEKVHLNLLAARTMDFYIMGIQLASVWRERAHWYVGVRPSR
jgi:hypothetical protein